jgi:hypothetical protein
MRRALLLAPVILAACGNQFAVPSAGPAAEAPMVTILRDGGAETVLRGSVKGNADGSATFAVASTGGQACRGAFGASGEGIFECNGGAPIVVDVPPEVYGQPSGSGVVAAGDLRIGFGWGDEASVDTVRAKF